MSTVVQRVYRPQIAAGLPGMIVDETRASVHTRQCEAAGGIGFGIAVTQGVGDTGANIGGTLFVGLTQKDSTLDRLPIDPLSTLDAEGYPRDTYPQYANMGVMDAGHMWVICAGGGVSGAANVKAGDPLFFTAAGTLTNAATGTAATGSIVFSKIPAAGETITVNAVVITFQASGATGDNMNVGGIPTLGAFVQALANKLGGSATAGLVTEAYRADPPQPGGPAQGSGANTLLIAAKAAGTAANAYTLASTCAGSTVSGATLAGGSAAATAVVGGYWLTSQMAGQIGQVSLGIAR